MTDAGKRLIRSATQARKIARGEENAAKSFIPPEIDVKGIRGKLRLTQDDFASEFGFSTSQIRDWEQNRFRPLGSDRAYLMIIEKHPEVVRQMLKEAIVENDPAPMKKAM